jgi:hypothetical protein
LFLAGSVILERCAYENKRQKSAAGFEMETKYDRDPDAERKFFAECKSKI